MMLAIKSLVYRSILSFFIVFFTPTMCPKLTNGKFLSRIASLSCNKRSCSGKLLTRHQKVFAHIFSLWCKIGSFRWKKVCLRPCLVQTITVFITKSIKILTIHENYRGEWKYKKRYSKWCGGYMHFVLF